MNDAELLQTIENGVRHTPSPTSLRSVLEKLDRIHSEFERRKQLGLPPPALHEIDRLFGREVME
jgi:hypothetical protein